MRNCRTKEQEQQSISPSAHEVYSSHLSNKAVGASSHASTTLGSDFQLTGGQRIPRWQQHARFDEKHRRTRLGPGSEPYGRLQTVPEPGANMELSAGDKLVKFPLGDNI